MCIGIPFALNRGLYLGEGLGRSDPDGRRSWAAGHDPGLRVFRLYLRASGWC